MSNEKNHDPAFPASPSHYGMSLLDWFAGQALASGNCPKNLMHDDSAAWAYREAVAMLAARKIQS